MSESIQHIGEVVEVSTGEVDVMIQVHGACLTCHAKAACGMAESQDKLVTIVTSDADFYRVGERVEVSIEQSMGIMAIFFAYLLPFFVVLTALLLMLRGGVGELVAGLGSLGSLVVYYLGLWLFRAKLTKQITFQIHKLHTEI